MSHACARVEKWYFDVCYKLVATAWCILGRMGLTAQYGDHRVLALIKFVEDELFVGNPPPSWESHRTCTLPMWQLPLTSEERGKYFTSLRLLEAYPANDESGKEEIHQRVVGAAAGSHLGRAVVTQRDSWEPLTLRDSWEPRTLLKALGTGSGSSQFPSQQIKWRA